MAFVFRSEKQSSLSAENNKSDLGPGTYYPSISKLYFKNNKAPFMVSSTKNNSKSNEECNYPGPGSYYKDEVLEKYNTLPSRSKPDNLYANLDVLNNLNNLDQNLSQINSISKEKLGFLGRVKRFKDEGGKLDTPGPGQYIKIMKKKILNDDKKEKNCLRIKKMNNKFTSRVLPETADLEYKTYPDEKFLIIKDPGDFNQSKEFDNSKNNIILNNLWLKNGTIWSKSETKKGLFFNKESSIHHFNETKPFKVKLSRSFDNNELITLKNNVVKNNKKNYTNSMLNINKIRKNVRKNLINEIKIKNKGLVDKFELIKNQFVDNPGPGYYYNETGMSSFKQIRNPEIKQNFQSNAQRFKTHQILDDVVGPGAYFRNDNNRAKTSYIKNNSKKIKNKKSLNIEIKRENLNLDTPGPGKYDPSKDFFKPKNYLEKVHFGSTEKRFVEFEKKNKSITPGPGSYLDNLSTANNTAISKWFSSANKYKKNTNDVIKNKKIQSAKIREIFPPVGTYDPELIFSIDYRNQKNCNKMSMVDTAFNSSVSKVRFENSEKDANIGPGYYYKEKRLHTTQVYPPFSINDIRFRMTKTDNQLGPGNYNHISHFDWNKKSFNNLYL